MKKLYFIIVSFFLIFDAFTCDYFNTSDYDNVQALMGKKSKIYDAYKQGKCVLEDVLQPLTNEQRKIIANLIAKSYTSVE
ncbi:MAG: hypothetical protein CBC53_001185 [Alphaproteobacteria bacterium TMED93]|nr:MAG: hypothetical protein CBC53_001185 [Alphaproteobacteria bacterium TMED93]